MRVRASFTGEKVEFPPPTNDDNLLTIFLSFIVAKLILIAMDDPIITRRFANMERDNLERILASKREDIDMVASAFRIRFEREDEMGMNYRIHVIDYIHYAKKFSSEEFRLINHDLKRGWLTIKREQFIKILREAFVEWLIEDIARQKDKGKTLRRYFSSEIEEIKSLKDDYISQYSSADFGAVDTKAFPPCMKVIISKIREGINVSHEARFALVAFLHQIGMSNEDILKIFASVPDFKKDITQYQVKHITGKISGKEYNVPKCATMRAFGICPRDMAKESLCYRKWMTHPLLYYRIKKGGSTKEHATQKQNAEQQ